MKKLLVVLALAMVGLLALPVSISAAGVNLEGTGTLMARGTGRAQIEGKLNFYGQARAAVLIVQDKAGDAKIDVKGYGKRIDEGNGKIRFVGFNGRAHIEGSSVAINLTGLEMRFVVHGTGEATLSGKGVYRVNGGPIKPWSTSGVTQRFNGDTASAKSERDLELEIARI